MISRNGGLLLLLLLVFETVSGQSPRAFPSPIDPPRGAIVPNSPARIERDLEVRTRDLRMLESRARRQSEVDKRTPDEPKLNAETISEVKRRRHVDDAVLLRYSSFLRQKNTGLFKIFPDLNCITAAVIRVDDGCKEFVPMSSGFSFRNGGYTDRNYHDIYYIDGLLRSFGFFAQGIFTSIGDVPIERLEMEHPSFSFLRKYKAEVSISEAKSNAKRFKEGFAIDAFKYADSVPVTPETTYLLRHIAYGIGNSLAPLSPSTSTLEMKFLSLSVDNRSDELIVFQIVKVDPDGGATIVWKRVNSSDAPKLKFSKSEEHVDLRDEREKN